MLWGLALGPDCTVKPYYRNSKFSVSAAIDPAQSVVSMTAHTRTLEKDDGTSSWIDETQSTFSGSGAAPTSTGTDTMSYDPGNPYAKDANTQHSVQLHFDQRFGVYLSDDENATIVDWQIGSGAWHSQILSEGLKKAQKDMARGLFARGFDMFKSGDFTGAKALFQSGMKIDPGNYLAWFTLAEIARSEIPPDSVNWRPESIERVYYLHTIDLAPNSPEAALAKGYLDALR